MDKFTVEQKPTQRLRCTNNGPRWEVDLSGMQEELGVCDEAEGVGCRVCDEAEGVGCRVCDEAEGVGCRVCAVGYVTKQRV